MARQRARVGEHDATIVLGHHGRAVASVDAGHRVAANLGGVEVGQVERGETLVTAESLEPTLKIEIAMLKSFLRP